MQNLSTHSDQTAYYEEQVKRYFSAFQKRERASVEKMLTNDFTFRNPADDHLSRERYFEKCWPTGGNIKKFHVQEVVAGNDEAYVLIETEPFEGNRFMTTEIFKFEGERISSVEVYLGVASFV
jgi:ketosteroid isomerase-like protein